MTPEQLVAGLAWKADRDRRYRLLRGDRDKWAQYSFDTAEAESENKQIRRGGGR